MNNDQKDIKSMDIISGAIKKLLGGLGEMRLYTQEETNELASETKRLQEAVNPTVENLRLQSQMVRAKADITVAKLQNVSEKAKATTDVAVAVADTIEVVTRESERYYEAEKRVKAIAAQAIPGLTAILLGEVEEEQNEFPQKFLQLPYRK